jgi:hypothetical protein
MTFVKLHRYYSVEWQDNRERLIVKDAEIVAAYVKVFPHVVTRQIKIVPP